MVARYLLDSDVLSEAARPDPSPDVVERLFEALDECVTAAPVVHELEFGVVSLPASRKKKILRRYMDDVVGRLPVLPYDRAAALWHATERARLSRKGRVPAFVDGQIAAIARTNGLTLVTRNVVDFRPFEGLVVENWF